MLKDALEKARVGRLKIIDIMTKTIDKPKEEISPYAPRVYSLQINPDKIRDVIGPGGKMIKEITAKSDTKIEIQDTGKIEIYATDMAHAQIAIDMIKALTEDLEIGRIYTGKVAKIMDFGAFVDFPTGSTGLVHISQLAHERVQNVRDVVEEGDEITVKVIGIDDRTGKVRLSRKEALPPKA
ncbi:MAG: Polyribonucleotide nucleotidyltransferase [Deltaproteobacteria bacterium ADurb.Bin510]|nr:MAG: Polyribonucleotide nucleotidyltransferase [Deltaproteobacteria bacterium ADurb.Bin510]